MRKKLILAAATCWLLPHLLHAQMAMLPEAPSRVWVYPGSSSTTLEASWSASEGATTYGVRWKRTADDEASWTETTGVTQTSISLSGLQADDIYDVQVRAANSNGDSSWTTGAVGYTNSTVRITNDGQTDAADETVTFGAFSPPLQVLATSFTTGAGQWLLGHVEIDVKSWSDGIETLYVRVFDASGGEPPATVFSGGRMDLTHPRPGTGYVKFTAPKAYSDTNPAVLEGNTTYWVAVFGWNTEASPPSMSFGATEGNGEDTGGSTGWSIGDTGRRQTHGTAWTSTNAKLNLKVWATGSYVPPGVNNAPAFDETGSITRTFDEHPTPGAAIGGPVSATDQDSADSLTYSLGGTDSLLFDFDTATGQIRARAGTTYDYERSSKTTFDVTVSVTDGKATESVSVVITMQDVEEPPSRPLAPTVVGASTTSVDVSWAAPENNGPDLGGFTLEYRKKGASTWAAVTAAIGGSERSHEIAGLEADTEYEVRLRAVNVEGMSAWSESGAGATLPKTAPEFDPNGDYSRSVAENSGAGVNVGSPVVATDPNMDTLFYALRGTDSSSFEVVSKSGQIRTRGGVGYDHESRSAYSVEVEASDGAETVSVTVSITITDVAEPPGAPGAPIVTGGARKTSLDVNWSAPTNTGPAIEDYELRYKKKGSASWSAGPRNLKTLKTTIGGLDAGAEYEVQVRATNDEGTSAWSGTGTGSTLSSDRPAFSQASYARSIAENVGGGRNIGEAIVAADDDTSVLSYTLEGEDSRAFVVGGSTGQITTKAGVSYDHEAKSGYSLTIRASDGTSSDTAAVGITLQDVNEPPKAPGPPKVTAASRTTLTVTWRAPDNTGRPPLTGYDLRYREKGDGVVHLDGPRAVEGTTGTFTGLVAGTKYEVQVRAINAEGIGAWSDPTEGKTDDPPSYDLEAPTLAVGVGDRTLRAEWNGPSDATAASGYDLSYRVGTSSDAWTEVAAVASGRGRHRAFLPRVLVNGTGYAVRVRQSRNNGNRLSQWSAVVTGTPADQGSGQTPVPLPKNTLMGGTLDGTADAADAFHFSSAETVCYVASPTLASLNVETDPPTSGRYVSTFDERVRRLVLDADGQYTLTLSAGSNVSYEVLCRDTHQATDLATAREMDPDFPADVLWTAKDDAYYFKFQAHDSRFVSARTTGALDTVVTLLNGDGDELARSDDGWQLGNVTNGVLQPMPLSEGVHYVRVSFPYTNYARRDEQNIALEVEVPDMGGGPYGWRATELSQLGNLESQGATVWLDTYNPVPLYHGVLTEAGEADYWRFTVSEEDGYATLFVRGTADAGAKLTVDVLQTAGNAWTGRLYERTETRHGGSFSNGRHVDAFTVAGRFSNGTFLLRVKSTDATVKGIYYTLTVARDTELDRYDDEADGGSCGTPRPMGVEDQYFPCQWSLGTFAGESMNVQEAWRTGYTGLGVEVAVFDSGYDWQHPDLRSNVVREKNLNVFGGGGSVPLPYPARHGGCRNRGWQWRRARNAGRRAGRESLRSECARGTNGRSLRKRPDAPIARPSRSRPRIRAAGQRWASLRSRELEPDRGPTRQGGGRRLRNVLCSERGQRWFRSQGHVLGRDHPGRIQQPYGRDPGVRGKRPTQADSRRFGARGQRLDLRSFQGLGRDLHRQPVRALHLQLWWNVRGGAGRCRGDSASSPGCSES